MTPFAKSTVLAAAMAGTMLAAVPAAEARVKTGTLVCNVSAGIGMIITSKKAMACTFKGVRGRRELYAGTITKYGLDIGVTSQGTIVWAVFEPTSHRGSLGGDYIGATAEATLVAGLGANVLVGGSQNSVALQPLSVSGQTGLNLAAGVGQISLRPMR
ncbi:DUF992 domain-containing protein [Labrys wisconsinensis]|uniref:DUF992 domain-containing protein n=1 Tax=Labrys wisconsinensis TaxID=425677 RepID=A0ABU0JF50_9HYPH|nr:DUF992 domain-containing protein [Labrys wisconsinensis]MDQ0472912.1 hypothetical protein [Labrys wisconsinensis]